jgi:hypothetical protein
MLAELPGSMPDIEGFLRCRLLALQLERGLIDEATVNFERIEHLLGTDEAHWESEEGVTRVQAIREQRGEAVDWRNDAAVARTRMLLATGRIDEAESWASGYLKQLRHLPQKDQIVLMLAYVWLERGELPMVQSWLRDVGIRPWPWADRFGDITTQMLAIDLDLAGGEFECAARKAGEAVEEARSLRRWSEFIGLSVRLAIARRELGDPEEATAYLVDALRTGLKGGFVRSFDVPGFTLAEGKSNKEIASSLFISVNTVRNHLVQMGKRLQTSSRTELVTRARRIGVLD